MPKNAKNLYVYQAKISNFQTEMIYFKCFYNQIHRNHINSQFKVTVQNCTKLPAHISGGPKLKSKNANKQVTSNHTIMKN